MKGGTYIPLTDFIMRKKAILNMENKDDKCFQWCVLRYLYPIDKHATRVSNLKSMKINLTLRE